MAESPKDDSEQEIKRVIENVKTIFFCTTAFLEGSVIGLNTQSFRVIKGFADLLFFRVPMVRFLKVFQKCK
jgi:hypothetical protein